MPHTHPHTDELLAAINKWTQPLVSHPTFRQLARSKIGAAREWEDDWPTSSERVNEVILPETLDVQHDAVMKFYNLWTATERLKTVEFYFRRYPFRYLPVSRKDHLENVCAMFFSQFYVIQEMIKVYLNALNRACAPASVDVGKTLQLFRKRFRAELDERHGATHNQPFDDLTINAVMLRALLDNNETSEGRAAARFVYQKASREWAAQARRGSARVALFLEGVAGASLQIATFLETPPTQGLEELKVR